MECDSRKVIPGSIGIESYIHYNTPVVYLDEIREGAKQAAETLNASRVIPRHILLAMLSRKDESIDLLEGESVDPDGLSDVLTKHGRGEDGVKGSVEIDSSALQILARAEELAKGYREEPGPEHLIWALSENKEFLNDTLLEAIGIDWEEIGHSMRRRVEARHSSHTVWNQALIANPGLHKAGVHKVFSDDLKDILKTAFESRREAGGGSIDIADILLILLDRDVENEIIDTLSGAGFDVEELRANLQPTGNDLERFISEDSVGFSRELIDALCEARQQLDAFPDDFVQRHHLLLGLLRVGEKTGPEILGESANMPYGSYQHVGMEIIHKRHGTPKLDLSSDADPEALKLLSRQQVRELRAIPVRIDDGKLIVGTPGYLGPHVIKRIERIVNMPVEPHISPGKWFKEHCGF